MSAPATCFDWPALTAHRRDREVEEPAAWGEALVHLDGCPACQRAALAADPTLLFRRLASPELDEKAEVESAIQAVSALRAARRVARRGGRLRRATGWGRWAAAAALAFLALSLGNEGLPGGPEGRLAVDAAALSRPPFAAGSARAEARIYHLDGDDLSVVMIVDESLDV